MTDQRWGHDRTTHRKHSRRAVIVTAVAAVLALPFLMHFSVVQYLNAGGATPDGRLPPWFALSFWAAELAIAIGAGWFIYRRSDEYERRVLVESAALGGAVMALLLPPVTFIGGYIGLMGDGPMLIWLVAVVVGLGSYALRLRRA